MSKFSDCFEVIDVTGRVIVDTRTLEADIISWNDLISTVRHTHAVDFRRASGDSVCALCGKNYYNHPHSEHRDSNDEPFLRRLCSGENVKL